MVLRDAAARLHLVVTLSISECQRSCNAKVDFSTGNAFLFCVSVLVQPRIVDERRATFDRVDCAPKPRSAHPTFMSACVYRLGMRKIDAFLTYVQFMKPSRCVRSPPILHVFRRKKLQPVRPSFPNPLAAVAHLPSQQILEAEAPACETFLSQPTCCQSAQTGMNVLGGHSTDRKSVV